MTTPLRAAVYVRVDPTDLRVSHALNNQIGLLIEYAERSDCEVVRTYREVAYAHAPRRPILEQVLSDAEHRTFDRLFVLEPEQLSRPAVPLSDTLSCLSQAGVRVVFVLDEEDAP